MHSNDRKNEWKKNVEQVTKMWSNTEIGKKKESENGINAKEATDKM